MLSISAKHAQSGHMQWSGRLAAADRSMFLQRNGCTDTCSTSSGLFRARGRGFARDRFRRASVVSALIAMLKMIPGARSRSVRAQVARSGRAPQINFSADLVQPIGS